MRIRDWRYASRRRPGSGSQRVSETRLPYAAESTDIRAPRLTAAVQWLIVLNVALYVVQATVVSPADVQSTLGFASRNVGHAWWTIGTYMFVHTGFWHLALNMYALWLFGPRLEATWGSREFVRYYVFCGLGGWFAHLAFVPGDVVLLGASAAVFGVMLAYATLWANEPVFVFGILPTTTRWLVVFIGALNLAGGMSDADGTNGVAYLAHVGGVVAGWLYLRATAAVSISRLRQSVSQVPDEPDDVPPRAVPKSMPRSRGRENLQNIDDVVAQSNAAVAKRPPRRTPHAAAPAPDIAHATDLDRVLDKISAHGLDSLTTDERQLLDDESRRRRDS
jgi:membrane associated rhomboid family serine protease